MNQNNYLSIPEYNYLCTFSLYKFIVSKCIFSRSLYKRCVTELFKQLQENNNNNRSLNSITHRKLALYMKILGQHFLNVFHSFVKYSSWAKIFMNCCIVYSPLEETIKNSLCVWYTIILEIHTDTRHIVTLKYYMKEQKVYVRIKGIKS